jgi:hypothetical protein
MLNRDHLLHLYVVSLRECIGDDYLIVFECMAEDADHAEEQALNAYPDGEVTCVCLDG